MPPAAHAILGLLELDESAGHGYDLARHFADGAPLAEIIRLEPAMLYHHLKRLAGTGWVASSVQPRGSRPPRQVYELTATGRVELRRWLGEPVRHTREIRLEFLLKLYFARRLDAALAARLIDDQAATCRGLETSLLRQLAALTEAPDDEAVFRRSVLDLRLAQTRAALTWLTQMETGGAASGSGASRGG